MSAGDIRATLREPAKASRPRTPPPSTTRAAPTVRGDDPAGPRACAVPVVPNSTAATRTY